MSDIRRSILIEQEKKTHTKLHRATHFVQRKLLFFNKENVIGFNLLLLFAKSGKEFGRIFKW